MKIGYTTIMHEPRIALDLSTDEYCILDLVYRLSVNPTAPVPGWCSMSKDNIAQFLGMPRRSLFRAIGKLTELDFLEKSTDGRLLKTTHKWIKNVVNFDFKNSGTHSAKVALDNSAGVALGHSAKVALNNNINNNNKKERDKGAFASLKIEFPSRLEQEILMPYKSKVKDFKKLILDFDATVQTEEFEKNVNYPANVLLARLGKFCRNWIQNQDRYATPTETINKQTNPNYATAI